MDKFFQDVFANLQDYYEQLLDLLPRLVVGIVLFLLLYRLAVRVKRLLYAYLLKRMDDALLARFLARIVKIIIVFTALMLFMSIVGLKNLAAGMITGASVSAIVIGFAFKDIVENFLAGVILAFHRPFRVGDVVELNGKKGAVVSLHLRTTHIKTADGQDVYIPNASIIKNSVVNYTIDGFIRQQFTIALEANSDLTKAIQITEQELKTVSGIIQEEKKPVAAVGNVQYGMVELIAYYWLDTFNKNYSGVQIRIEAMTKVLDALKKAGYSLPRQVVGLQKQK